MSDHFYPIKKILWICALGFLLLSAGTSEYEKKLFFSGHSWLVKRHATKEGPGPNYFSDSDSSVWVDNMGALHLTIRKEANKWLCSELICLTPLTMGKLEFHVQGFRGKTDPNTVLGMFTWSTDGAGHHKEADIEISAWGKTRYKFNTQFVMQPAKRKKNKERFILADHANCVFSIQFSRNKTEFRASDESTGKILHSFILKRGIRDFGGVHARINFWLYKGMEPVSGNKMEVIISGFKFIPS